MCCSCSCLPVCNTAVPFLSLPADVVFSRSLELAGDPLPYRSSLEPLRIACPGLQFGNCAKRACWAAPAPTSQTSGSQRVAERDASAQVCLYEFLMNIDRAFKEGYTARKCHMRLLQGYPADSVLYLDLSYSPKPGM